MSAGSLAGRITTAPLPWDRERAESMAAVFDDQPGQVRELLAGTAGCSPYLASSMEREADWLREVLSQPPETVVQDLLGEMADEDPRALGVKLRMAKRRTALLVALADLGGVWPLEAVTGALTELADRAVQQSLQTLVAARIARGKLPGCDEADAADAAGMFVVAMGKMGAGELNYSSDIDLIVLFDETRYGADDYAKVRREFIRVTQQMVRMLSEGTGEGYVFRTDLRLRPDPSVTPVCIATEPAEQYYESLGRTWERAAYIKARICGGAVAAGESFLERLRPFVWRRHLDYAAIQDAHDMRQRIRSHKGLTGALSVPGHDVKLGHGGIREIEFFTQTRQLILGGRNPDLRDRRTRPALAALAENGWVEPGAAETLSEAYVELRTLEHRLQMVDDAQTQKMPTSPDSIARIACFCGESDVARFGAELRERFTSVHELTEPFFSPDATKAEDAPEPGEVFSDTGRAQDLISGWQSLPALRTDRARTIFRRLEPRFLQRMARAHNADEALASLDAFLSRLPAGVQLFSLMEAHPPLMDLLVDICATTPELARYLGRNAGVLDAVLSPDFFQPLPPAAELTRDLATRLEEVPDYEAALNGARVWMKERHFRIGVHLLRGLADAEETGTAYSAVAEAVLDALLPCAVREFGSRHGEMPGAGAAVVGMGKMGSREMTVSSDLDLIVIYDARGQSESTGRRPLPVTTYYARLTQAMIAALSAPMADGLLYEVDMRLRPSGRQGPVATSIASFREYQKNEAWTWEHLALTRARVVAGPDGLRSEVSAAIGEVLERPNDPANVLDDAREMRKRLAEAHGKDAHHPWETKKGPGRMMDIELLAQSGALIHNLSRLRRPRQMLDRLAATGWITQAEADLLISCLWRLATLQQIGRLASDHTIDPREGGEGLVHLVLSATGSEDVETLGRDLAGDADRCAEIIGARLAAP